MGIDSQKHSELLVLYKDIVNDIRFTKTQIWNTSYLTILAVAGLIGIALYIHQSEKLEIIDYKFFLITLITSIGLLGFLAIIFHQMTLERYRKTNEESYTDLLHSQDLIKSSKTEPKLIACFFCVLHPMVIIGVVYFGISIICRFS